MPLRPLKEFDGEALLSLLRRSLPFDELSPGLVREKVWGDPDFCARNAWVVEGPDGGLKGFAMGVERNGRGYLKFLCVDPDHRADGLGGRLLEVVEKGMSATTIRVAESNPNYLVPGVDVRHTVGLLFLDKHGYQKVGETYNLLCDLQGDVFEEEPPSTGLRIDRARSQDWPGVELFLARVFPGWLHEVGVMMKNTPVSLHLAWKDGQVVGFSGYDGNNLGHGWFGPMGTDPEQRGLGVGRILLRRCLSDLRAQGHKTCVIPWVGPYGFYARHSLSRIDRVFWRYEKVRR